MIVISYTRSLWLLFLTFLIILWSPLSLGSVLPFSSEQRAFLQANPVIKVGNQPDRAPFDFNHNDKAQGYSVELLKLLAPSLGIRFEFIPYDSEQSLLEGFKNQEVSLLHARGKSMQQPTDTHWSESYYASRLAVFTRKEMLAKNLTALEDKTLVLVKGSSSAELESQLPHHKIMRVDTLTDALYAVLSGKADYLVDNVANVQFLMIEQAMSHLQLAFFPEFSQSLSNQHTLHFAAHAQNTSLLELIEIAYQNLPNNQLLNLKKKWFGFNTENDNHQQNTLSIQKPSQTTLSLSAEEEAFLEKHPVIRVSNEMDWPPFDFAVGNTPSGYSIDLLKLIAKKLDIELNFINGHSWDELWQMFEAKQIDITHPVAKNDYRQRFGLYTKRLYSGKYVFLTKSDAPKIHSVHDLFDKVVATPKSWAQTQYIQDNFPEIKLLLTDNEAQSVQAVRDGQAFATFGNDAVLLYKLKKEMDRSIKVNALFKEFNNGTDNDLFFLVRKDWPLLHQAFEKALASLTIQEVEALQTKWFGKNPISQERIALSTIEQEYLQTHPILYVSNETNYPPFDFAINGKPMGYSIDLIKILAQKIGFDIKFINGQSWKQLIQSFQSKKIDLLHTAHKTPERQLYALFSKPYYQNKNFFFTHPDTPEIKSLKDLQGKIVASGQGWATSEYLAINHPEIRLLALSSSKEMIDAVENGEAYAAIASQDTLQYFLQTQTPNIKINKRFEQYDSRTDNGFHFLAQKDSQPLIDMLNRAMGTMTPGEWKQLQQKWLVQSQTNPFKIKLTQEEIKFLKQHPVIHVQNEMDYPPYDFVENGKPAGFSIDYLRLIAEKTGLNLKFVNGLSWHELLQAGQSRKIDIMHTLVKTQERSNFLKFTQPYIKDYYSLILPAGSNIQDLSNPKHKFVILKSDSIAQKLRKAYPDVSFIEYESTLEMLKDVIYHKVDGAVMGTATASYLARKEMLPTLQYRHLEALDQYLQPWHIAVRSDWPVLHGLIEKGMQALSYQEVRNLRKTWLGDNLDTTPPLLQLSPQERDFLNSQPNLQACIHPNWMPFDQLNKQHGSHGLGQELRSMIADRLQTPIQIRRTEFWKNSQTQFQLGKCQLLFLAPKYPSENIDFTDSFISLPLVVATHESEPYIDNFDQVQTQSFAILDDKGLANQISQYYPQINLIRVKNIAQGLEKVKNREVYGYIDISASLGFAMDKTRNQPTKISGKLPITVDLSIGIAKNNDLLLNIMQKALASIDKQERQRLYQKWNAVQQQRVVDYTLVWQVLFAGGLLMLLVIYWNRKIVKAKNALEKANQLIASANQEIETKNQTLKKLATTDKLTGLYNRNRLDELLQKEIERSQRYSHQFSLCIIDIDFFKQVNDNYGHIIGDQVLETFAQLLRTDTRVTDILGRWGGEEFVILFPETPVPQAHKQLESLRQTISQHRFAQIGQITASFGLTHYQTNDTPTSILKRADDALYQAKLRGRNRIEQNLIAKDS